MSENFADRLLAAITEKGLPACVGLDPVFDRLPEEIRRLEPCSLQGPAAAADEAELPHLRPVLAMEVFCKGVIEAVAETVPAVKPQIACFERYGFMGLMAYERVVAAARSAGLIVIGDVKRGDIGSSAAHYAAWHLGEGSPDAITVNGYFGADGLAPFVDSAAAAGKGLFVLVRTSNPSAATIQDFTDAGGRKFYEHIAEQVAAVGSGEGLIGESGFSCVGAVVGATYPDEARRLREIMPQQVFLVPGYGAQGATAADAVAGARADGAGVIVNASRSVIYAYEKDSPTKAGWKDAVARAARRFADDVAGALKSR